MQYFDKKAVGERIRQIRRQRNMKQYELAAKLGHTNQRQLQRIENGENSCSVDKLMEIAQILQTSTDYLFFGEEYEILKIKNNYNEFLDEKTEKKKEFVDRILKAVIDNLSIID